MTLDAAFIEITRNERLLVKPIEFTGQTLSLLRV
jgi:hypothetical protein